MIDTEPLFISSMRKWPTGEVRHIPGGVIGMLGTSTVGFLAEYDTHVNQPRLWLATNDQLLAELQTRIITRATT